MTTQTKTKTSNEVMTEDGIEVLDLPPQPTLTSRFQVAPEDLSARMHTVLDAVRAHAGEVGAELSGAPFTRIFGFDEQHQLLDVEVGFPVTRKAEGSGEVQPSELPGGKTASLVHRGSYETLPQAHATLMRWSVEHGHPLSGAPWEVYQTNPVEERDVSAWRTQVLLHLQP